MMITYEKLALVLVGLVSLGTVVFSDDSSSYHHYDPYSFGYDVEDHYGNKQWRQEHSSKPMEVHGSYGYHDVNGVYREVTYVADKDGFRAKIKTNEPGVSTAKEPAATHMDPYYPSVPSELKHVKASRQKKLPSSRAYLDPLLDHKKYLLSSFYKSQKNYP